MDMDGKGQTAKRILKILIKSHGQYKIKKSSNECLSKL